MAVNYSLIPHHEGFPIDDKSLSYPCISYFDNYYLCLTERKTELLQKWNEGWNCLFNAIDPLTPEQLSQIVYIRNEGQTVVEAINRQLCHYSYHIGQIVFYAKMLKKSDWESLSIPKNKSNDYNVDKFSKDKSIKNFTDDELNRLK